jgi:hypothetical protein
MSLRAKSEKTPYMPPFLFWLLFTSLSLSMRRFKRKLVFFFFSLQTILYILRSRRPWLSDRVFTMDYRCEDRRKRC